MLLYKYIFLCYVNNELYICFINGFHNGALVLIFRKKLGNIFTA